MDKRSNAYNHNLCHFSFSDGRRCRMLRHADHPGLCPFHSREERLRIESERIGTELAATLTGDFLTATDINHVLGKVFTALAQDRISIKKARALAYLAQLMLHSLRGVGREYKFKYDFEAWQRMLKNSVQLPAPLEDIEDDYADSDDSTNENSNAAESESDSGVVAGHAPFSDALNVGAAGTSHVRAGFSPSPTAASSAPLGGGPSAPTYKTAQSANLSSAHPSAPSADARADSSQDADEDTTEEPALAGAGSTTRRGS